MQQIANKVHEEFLVSGASWYLAFLIHGALDLGLRAICGLDKIKHAHEELGLCLEACLVVRVAQDEEDILEDRDEELLEECIGRLGIRLLRDVGDKLEAHVKASALHVSIVMLASPQAGVYDKLELAVVQFQQRYAFFSFSTSPVGS